MSEATGWLILWAQMLHRLVFCAVLLLSPLMANFASADEPGVVFASALNVRARPSLEGEVVSVLPERSFVLVVGKRGDWLRVRYMVGEDLESGWVSMHHVRIVDVGDGEDDVDRWKGEEEQEEERDECDEFTAYLSVAVDDSSLKCQRAPYDGGALDRCGLWVSYTVTSSCYPTEKIFKRVRCTAELVGKTSAGRSRSPKLVDASTTERISGTTQSGRQYLSGRVGNPRNPVVSVRAQSVSCDIH